MVNLSMPGFINKALTKNQHAIPPRPQHQPYISTPIQYVAKAQHVVELNTSTPLTKYQIKHVQYIVVTLLDYRQSVNSNIVTALSEIASPQAKSTEEACSACHQLLDYISTLPSSAIQYHASDMILAIDNDASYLSENSGKLQAAT